MKIKNYFKGKKITIMGLGLLGRGVGDAKFLEKNGADLLVTDLKSKKELKVYLDRLKKYKKIKYILGRHRFQDFRDKDMILKAADAPLDSPYIAEARKNNIPIEMDASLFAKLTALSTSNVDIIGITGTRGKSTVTHLIYSIIKNSGRRVYLGGNVKGLATLPLLERIKDKDVVVMELDSWQLQGFGEAKISPNIAVFSTFLPDHQNYYKNDMDKYFSDKANIFKFQKENDYLVVGERFFHNIKSFAKNAGAEIAKDFKNGSSNGNLKRKTVIAKKSDIPHPPAGGWKVRLLG